MLEFATPSWLLLTPLPLFLWLWHNKLRKSELSTAEDSTSLVPTSILHSQADILISLGDEATIKQRFPWWWILGGTLLLIAMARPQWLDYTTAELHPAHNIMMAVDVSGSMRAQDFIIDGKAVSRLDMIKLIARQFLEKRSGDRIGLIAFGDDAMTVMPMTTDITLMQGFLEEITTGIAGERTAVGEAIALAVNRLTRTPHHPSATSLQESRILILLTDGTNTAGSVTPEAAVLLAKQEAIRIYTIGVGTNKEVAFPRGPVMDPLYTELPLDEASLRHIADETGGHYYHADNTKKLQQILSEINKLETSDIQEPDTALRQEWYWLPLLAGLVLLCLAETGRQSRVLPC